MKRLLLALLLGLAVATALATDVYQSDPDHTFAWFEYSHMGLSTDRERFDKVNATVSLDLQNQTGSVQASIDVNSLNTGSSLFNHMLLSDAFFDAVKYPTITFQSTHFTFGRLDNVTAIDGDLTIKDITRPVTLRVTNYKCMMHPLYHRPVCGLNASAKVERSDFNLGKYVPLITNDITLYVSIEAIQH
jgi:polyisoprenoid-binding protein YceI